MITLFKKFRLYRTGESLISLIMSIAILGLLVGAIATLQLNVFKNIGRSRSQSQINTQVSLLLHNFSEEVRSAQISGTGSYPLEKAADNEVIFYSDIGSNGVVERVRYTLTNQTIQRGVVTPSGNPLTYNIALEKTSTPINNIVGSGPLFSYFNSTYNGATQTGALVQPVAVQNVRAVQIHFVVDPKTPNVAFTNVTTTIEIRNLKDN